MLRWERSGLRDCRLIDLLNALSLDEAKLDPKAVAILRSNVGVKYVARMAPHYFRATVTGFIIGDL